jgi:nucleoside-diphosphate-sugar epimerase
MVANHTKGTTHRALVIGGTGPTGHFIVNGLIARGYTVSILHTGTHEVAEIPAAVEHIHSNPFDTDQLASALGDRTWDLTIATYGRLRRVAEVFAGRTGRFMSIGGGPAYRGYMNADAVHPRGLMVPTPESAPKVRSEAEDGKGYRVLKSEEIVFDLHPDATHFRYPVIYGRYQLAPREWSIVKRILDRRPYIIVPDAGLTLQHFGAAENMAHAVLLAVDKPARSKGQIYNCGDDKVLTIRQVVDICTEALGYQWDVVSMPYRFAVPARPLVAQPWTTHRVFDLSKIKAELGYRDIVDPIDAIAEVAHWYARHPVDARGERNIQDPFDYAAEDTLVAAWKKLSANMPAEELFAVQPGYTASYSGPGGSVRKSEW